MRTLWISTVATFTLFLGVVANPAVATADVQLTDVSVHLSVSDASGNAVNPQMDQLFINVLVEGESVMYSSTGTEDGENFIFPDVPIYETAEYFVWLDPESKTPGFLKTGAPDSMADGMEYYPLLSSSWTGLSADPETIELEVEILDPIGGSVCGAVVNLENDTLLSGVDVSIESTATIGGVRYALKSSATAEESGTYCFDGLPLNYTYTVSFDPWSQEDSTYSDANYSSANESLQLRGNATNRSLLLYTWIEDDGNTPAGDLIFQLNVEDPDGNAVDVDGLNFIVEGAGGYGTTSSGGNSVILTGLAPGQYTVRVQNQDGERRVASTSDVIVVSADDPAANDATFVVYTTPEGTGGIEGTLDWAVESDVLSGSVVSLTAISVDTPWNLPAGASFDAYYETSPNEEGHWAFENIPDGTYRVNYPFLDDEGSGQAWTTISEDIVTVDNGEFVDNGIQPYQLIESVGDTLSVKVKNSVTRLPVAGATCFVQIYDGIHTYQSVTSDANGVATFENLFRGYTYDVRCWSWGDTWGIGGRANAVTVHAGTNLYIMPFESYSNNGHATGRVVDANGNPLDGIRVSASQSWTIPDCECGDGFSVNDITAEDGTFQLDGFVTGRDVTMTVVDRSHELATSTFTYRADSADLVDLGDLVLRAGADVTGRIEDLDGNPISAGVILREIEIGNEIYGQSDVFGVVSFDEPVPLGDYSVFVATNWAALGQQEQGYITEEGELSLAEEDALIVTISDPEPEITELPTAVVGAGATISGTGTFVDAEGSPLSGNRYDAKAHFYLQTGDGWQEITRVYGWASSELGGHYSLSGLPAGHYKVCFRDYFTTTNRFAEVCNGGSSNLDDAPMIIVDAGETVTGINVEIKFRQPEAPPQPINFDELDQEVLAQLQDQIEIVETAGATTTVQLDVDLAGQWIAAEVIANVGAAPVMLRAPIKVQGIDVNHAAAPMAIPRVSEWLQVNALGEVELPTDQLSSSDGETLAVLSSDNILVGWTEVSIASATGGSGDGDTTGDIATIFEDEPVTDLADGEVEKSTDGGVAADNTAGPAAAADPASGLYVTLALLGAVIVGAVTATVRRGRRAN